MQVCSWALTHALIQSQQQCIVGVWKICIPAHATKCRLVMRCSLVLNGTAFNRAVMITYAINVHDWSTGHGLYSTTCTTTLVAVVLTSSIWHILYPETQSFLQLCSASGSLVRCNNYCDQSGWNQHTWSWQWIRYYLQRRSQWEQWLSTACLSDSRKHSSVWSLTARRSCRQRICFSRIWCEQSSTNWRL